jgi:hypothetical protein
MQLIYTPTLPPGCCFICRASVRESYIDTAVSIDYEGAFYICNQCVAEMAVKYAYLSHDEYKDLRQSKEDLEAQNFVLIKRMGELEDIHDALVRGGYKLNDDGIVVRIGGYSSAFDEHIKSGASGAEAAMGVGEGETPEQSDDEGVGELHSDESGFSEFKLEL